MIPKIIHYCWFGDTPLKDEYKEYINEWSLLNPDFKIKEWNNSNIPAHITYLETAINNKNWANASNYVRFYALRTEGGIYMDTDMKVLSSLNSLLKYQCFLGFESGDNQSSDYWVNNAIMGSVPNHEFVIECEYTLLEKFDGTEKANLSAPQLVTNILKKKYQLSAYGEQLLSDIMLFEKEVFYPLPYEKAYLRKNNSDWGLTSKTIAIHMWGRSWFTQEMSIDLIDYYQTLKIEQQQINIGIQKKLDESKANLELRNIQFDELLSKNNQLIQNLTTIENLSIKCENHFKQLNTELCNTKNSISDLHKINSDIKSGIIQIESGSSEIKLSIENIATNQKDQSLKYESLFKRIQLLDILETKIDSLVPLIENVKKIQSDQKKDTYTLNLKLIELYDKFEREFQSMQSLDNSIQNSLNEQDKKISLIYHKLENSSYQLNNIIVRQHNTENIIYNELDSLKQNIEKQKNTINELTHRNSEQAKEIQLYKERYEEASVLKIIFRKLLNK